MKSSSSAEKTSIIRKVLAQQLPAYKSREIDRLKRLCQCNPQQNSVEQYYQCIDGINKPYDQSTKKLNKELLIIDNNYEQKLKKCGAGDVQCWKRVSAQFQADIKNRYTRFYSEKV